MEAPPDGAFFPLAFELFEGKGRKPFFRSSAAATKTNEQMAVLNSNLLCKTIRADNLPQRAMLEILLAHKPLSKVLSSTGFPCGVWRYALAQASLRAASADGSVNLFAVTMPSSACNQ